MLVKRMDPGASGHRLGTVKITGYGYNSAHWPGTQSPRALAFTYVKWGHCLYPSYLKLRLKQVRGFQCLTWLQLRHQFSANDGAGVQCSHPWDAILTFPVLHDCCED